MDLPKLAAFDDFLGLRNTFAMAPLRTHNHDAVVFARCLDHPPAFVDEQGHRLFDIHVLARRAGHDGEQRVPVVRRGHNDPLNVFVLIHPAEIAVPFRTGISDVLETFLQARLVDIAETHQIDIAELFEIGHVLFADQPEPDEPDADTVICAENPFVLCGRQGGRTQELSPGDLDRFQFI